MRRLTTLVLVLILLLVAAPASARPYWKRKVDRIIGKKSVGVVISHDGDLLYNHGGKQRRAPASNEKLLMSLALFDRLGPNQRLVTSAASKRLPENGVLRAHLWIRGRGDPSVVGGGSYEAQLPFKPTRIGLLAKRIAATGIERIKGRIFGSTAYFARDWFAPGWKSDFPAEEVALPTALAFEGNQHKGRHISDPELRAARILTKRLREQGVKVSGRPGAGEAPPDLNQIATIRSQPIKVLARYMNRWSSNFFAEMLGKLLGADRYGTPGTIAKGAAAIESWASVRGVSIDANDASGLSYNNRVSPFGMAKLLTMAATESWWAALKKSLPAAGQGTLEDRLSGVRLRAKTGTLEYVSTLSGWVWLKQAGAWAEFSIMSRGMYKSNASEVEDRVLRTVTELAG